MAIPNQPGALPTVGPPPLVPLHLLEVAAVEVGITGLALREALAVEAAPTATQDLELRAKETTVVAEMVGPQATIREEAEAAQPAAEAQAAQTQAALVAQELVHQ